MMTLESALTNVGSPAAGLAVRATIFLLAAWLGSLALRRAAAAARHLVWLGAVVGLLILPVLAEVQHFKVPILPSAARAVQADVPARRVPIAQPTSELRTTAPVVAGVGELDEDPAAREILTQAVSGGPKASAVPVATIILGIWLSVAAGLLAWLVLGALSVRSILRQSHELVSLDWKTALGEAADRLDIRSLPRLFANDRIEMAFACDVLHPTIVLPGNAQHWTADRRRAVLLHELAHVRRRDLLGHAIGRLACRLYWFHPLAWVAARRLRAESERACDDLVLSSGAAASDYAQHLLDLVMSVRAGGAPALAVPMARRKEFEGRLLAILDPDQSRCTPGRLRTLALVGPLALVAIAVGAVSPARRSAPSTSPSRGTRSAGVTGLTLPSSAAPNVRPQSANDLGSSIVPVAQLENDAALDSPRATSYADSVRDSAGVRIVEHPRDALLPIAFRLSPTPIVDLPPNSGDPRFTLQLVGGAARLSDGRIVVLVDDMAPRLVFFSVEGKPLASSGQESGRLGAPGGGILKGASQLVVLPGDTLAVASRSSAYVSLFTDQGTLVRVDTLGSCQGVLLSRVGGAWLDRNLGTAATPPFIGSCRAVPGGRAPVTSLLSIPRGDPQMTTVRSMTSANGMLGSFSRPRPFGRTPVAGGLADGFVVGDAVTYELREYATDGRLRQIVRRDVDLQITDSLAAQYVEGDVTTNGGFGTYFSENTDSVRNAAQAHVGAMRATRSMMPAYDQLRVDDIQRIWVRDYLVSPSDAQRWTVFDSSGTMLGTVVMPPGFRVQHIGRDYLIGVTGAPDRRVQVFGLVQ